MHIKFIYIYIYIYIQKAIANITMEDANINGVIR
jgi:hypothetical protein